MSQRVKLSQGLGRVRRLGQEVRELFDQRRCHSQIVNASSVRYLLAISPGHPECIISSSGEGPYFRQFDVNVEGGNGIGELE